MTRRLEAASVLAFFVLVAALSTFAVESADLGFHIATGARIWSVGAIPTEDPFSYLAEGRPWIDSHWLFQLLAHAAYRAADAPGLVLLRVALVLSTFGLTLRVARRRGGLAPALLVSVLAVLACHDVFILRPTLLSLLFLAVFVYGVDGLARHPTRWLIALPIVQAIWVNSHGLWVLGLGYVGLYWLGGVLQDLAHRRVPAIIGPGPPAPRLRREALLLALCGVASLANANGIDGITYPWTLLVELYGDVAWFPRLVELKPPLSIPVTHPLAPEVFYRVLLALSILAALARWKTTRFSELLPFVVFMALSLRSGRNIALFALVAVPFTAANLRGLWLAAVESPRFRPPSSRRVAMVTTVAMLLLAGTAMAGTVSNEIWTRFGWARRFGLGESTFYPAGIVEHLRGTEGRVYNDSNMGGYLIWKLYPDKQVAVDGRWEIYGELLLEMEAAMQGPSEFSEFARQHDIRTIALMRRSADSRTMRRWLRGSREWRLRRRTPMALVFEKAPDPADASDASAAGR